jgi:hypothetical protein
MRVVLMHVMHHLLMLLCCLQNPFKNSLGNHFLISYHRALVDIIKTQLESDEHRRTEGIEDLMQLLKVLYNRQSLKYVATGAGGWLQPGTSAMACAVDIC